MLAPGAALAGQQRGGDGLRTGEAGQLVGQDGANQSGPRLVGATLDGGQPRERLDQRVVDRLGRIGSALAEAADRDLDDVGRHGADGVVVHPHALDDAGPEVLHEDVGARRQGHQHLDAARVLEVERHRALVAVVVEERGRKAAVPVGDAPGMVAAAKCERLRERNTLCGEKSTGAGKGQYLNLKCNDLKASSGPESWLNSPCPNPIAVMHNCG